MSKEKAKVSKTKPTVRKVVKKVVAKRGGTWSGRTVKPKTGSRVVSESVEGGGTDAVDAFLKALDHPYKKTIEEVRRVILGVGKSGNRALPVREIIKWNSVTFRASDDFATVHWRYRGGVQLVFHTGAKAKPESIDRDAVAAAATGLGVKWLGPDRCLVTLEATEAIVANKGSGKMLRRFVADWIARMEE